MTSNAAPPPITSSAKKQAAFSDTIFVVGTRLLVKKGSDIKDFKDLAGKPGSGHLRYHSEVLLNKLNDSDKMNMRIISQDHGDSFRTGKRARRGLHDG